jgi:hypothetical protein
MSGLQKKIAASGAELSRRKAPTAGVAEYRSEPSKKMVSKRNETSRQGGASC